MQRVPLGDATIAYHDEGHGPVLLLMHGFTGTARSHLGALIDNLKADYRVIAPDLRGYGASQPPMRDFPADFYQRDAADMAALLDHLQLGPVVALGFSDGAESALVLAASRPDLVRGAVAWGVAGVIAQAMVDSVQSWLPTSAWGPERADWREEIITNHGAAQFPSMIEGWVAGTAAIAAAGGNVCLNEAAQIACPTLLVNGDGEVGNPPEDVRRLAERIPNCELEFVANSGHAIHEDQFDQFVALVRGFLLRIG